MNPVKPATTAVIALACAAVFSGCGTSDVTRARLEASLGPTFANLYLRQAEILGRPPLTVAGIDARPSCDRGGPNVADTGPGADWICMVDFIDADHNAQTGKFELQARANSCYTAGGPSKLIGLVTITDTHGKEVPNPVFEFDGCFDPRG